MQLREIHQDSEYIQLVDGYITHTVRLRWFLALQCILHANINLMSISAMSDTSVKDKTAMLDFIQLSSCDLSFLFYAIRNQITFCQPAVRLYRNYPVSLRRVYISPLSFQL